ncbi:MAG: hypothetical protein ACRCXT_08090 [Paraclostridium sp.]
MVIYRPIYINKVCGVDPEGILKHRYFIKRNILTLKEKRNFSTGEAIFKHRPKQVGLLLKYGEAMDQHENIKKEAK